jgi:large subunit ribosomal protein L4e
MITKVEVKKKAPVLSLSGEEVKKVKLPAPFFVPFRPELIHRAFWALFTHSLQPKGTDPYAGKKTTAESWGVGHGIARIARVKGQRYSRAGQAAGVASVVKGRQAHPPRVEKNIRKEINKKERWLATASAIAATAIDEVVKKRGHKIIDVKYLPLIVSDKVEELKRTKDVIELLKILGLEEEVIRLERSVKRRSGKARRRGRTKREAKGPLFVVSEDKGIMKAVGSIPGVECVLAKDVSVLDLAPGGHAGRLVIWSESALKHLSPNVVKVSEKFLT